MARNSMALGAPGIARLARMNWAMLGAPKCPAIPAIPWSTEPAKLEQVEGREGWFHWQSTKREQREPTCG